MNRRALAVLLLAGAAGTAGAPAASAAGGALPPGAPAGPQRSPVVPALSASSAAATAPVAPAARTAQAAAAPDHRQENKALVRRYLTEVLAAGRLDHLDQIVAADFTDRSPGAPAARGPEVVRQIRQNLGGLFAKLDYTPQELIAEDDRVAAHYLVVATPRPERGHALPRPVVVDGLALFRVRAGRIQEVFVLNDRVTLLRELGFTLVPPRPAGGPGATPGGPTPPAASTGAAPPPGPS